MICPICKEAGIKNTANGQEFYYCRNCKKEIFLEVVEPEKKKEPDEQQDFPFAFPWFSDQQLQDPTFTLPEKTVLIYTPSGVESTIVGIVLTDSSYLLKNSVGFYINQSKINLHEEIRQKITKIKSIP